MLSINVPFPGFYHSGLDQMLDSEVEQFCEYEAERQADSQYSPETFQPEPLRLDSGEIADIVWNVARWSPAHQMISESYLEAFDSIASEEVGFPLRLRFEETTSPREYNFETDRLFAQIANETARKLFRHSKAAKHERLAAVIAERFTSRSGFISFYSSNLSDWLAKPLMDWDHNELGTLLIACLAERSDSSSYDSIEYDIEQSLCDASLFYEAFEAAINWPEYEERVADARREKAEELSESELERYGITADAEQAAPRCDSTLDLFAAQAATDAR